MKEAAEGYETKNDYFHFKEKTLGLRTGVINLSGSHIACLTFWS